MRSFRRVRTERGKGGHEAWSGPIEATRSSACRRCTPATPAEWGIPDRWGTVKLTLCRNRFGDGLRSVPGRSAREQPEEEPAVQVPWTDVADQVVLIARPADHATLAWAIDAPAQQAVERSMVQSSINTQPVLANVWPTGCRLFDSRAQTLVSPTCIERFSTDHLQHLTSGPPDCQHVQRDIRGNTIMYRVFEGRGVLVVRAMTPPRVL